ncbi:ATP-binding cassette domain-containing protein [Conexibacter stalactiti]|uniref:ATP-binding cassette domain-containing protein n=1 Tax=Conexibacter stalactiti TaxID=1940611 RepID=A0ABU4HYZ2_9ACTN|nr:ATP-binding cassette domain-containing protein [Conexibacter stalactiti]MDW5598440.1 ATP-binding cassette domain-containing protein [Conexibacter stalactiti]MEC5039082.1 ATP-binding cassette domain-containing protein [Conexibacter stalactiti]
MAEPLLEVRSLVKVYGGRRVVDDVSFTVARGETLGLVGESGSGKSTSARCVLRMIEADGGEIRFDGEDVLALQREQLRRLRRRMQVVFQDPHGSLNRRQTVAQALEAPLKAHGLGDKAARTARVAELLELVGLASGFAQRRPDQLSGGQAQRVAIARALALEPEFVVLDEAVSALDVSVRAQVLNLLTTLQRELGLTYLFISHDLAIVRYMAHHVAVMRHGRIVEAQPRERLFAHPQHEYTRSLMDAIPVADPETEQRRILGVS